MFTSWIQLIVVAVTHAGSLRIKAAQPKPLDKGFSRPVLCGGSRRTCSPTFRVTMTLARAALVFALLLGAIDVRSAHAQDPDNSVAIGVPKFNTVTNGPDVTNLGNLNVHWEFPIVDKPGRGLPFKFALTFDNSVWKNNGHSWSPTATFGWAPATTIPNGTSKSVHSQTLCSGTGFNKVYVDRWENWTFVDDSNIGHPFTGAWYQSNNCTSTTTTSASVTATDGSGYILVPGPGQGVISTPSGLTMTAGGLGVGSVSSIRDSNGNQLIAQNTSLSATWRDTLDMVAVTFTKGDRSTGPPYAPDTYAYTDTNGAQQVVTVNYSAYTLQTGFACPNITEYTATAGTLSALASSVAYPDGSKYLFTYEPTPGNAAAVTGRLGSVTLPTGGVIQYAYPGANDGINCSMNDSSTIGLSRTTPDGKTTYSRTNVSGTEWKTSVTYPPDPVSNQQNQTDIYFQDVVVVIPSQPYPANLFYETKRQIFQGSDQGKPLETVHTCYNASNPDCTAVQIILPITQTTELTQLASGQEKQRVTSRNTAGLVTEIDEYDYGTTAPGALLKKTLTEYYAPGGNVVDRPHIVTIQDGAQNQIAQTQYLYDESAPPPLSNVPNHVPGAGASGLNATTVKRWLKTTNTFMTSTNSYDDTGNLITTTDPLGNQITFDYTDNFSDSVNRNTLAYVTKTTFPDTNSPTLAHHITSRKYDANIGRKVSSIDQNGQKTDYGYDLRLRPTSVTLPPDINGNRPTTALKYSDPNTVLEQKTITTPALTDTVTAKLDGLGRTAHLLHATPSGTATTDAGYDNMGRQFTLSNPYFATSDPTYGVTQTLYDALGRAVKTTKQDGSTVTGDYSGGTCLVTTDEAGNPRRSCVDGLGRLIEVDESGDAFNGTAATGSIPINAPTGGLQSKVVGGQPATYAIASVTINGAEQSKTVTLTGQPCPNRPSQQTCTTTVTVRDSGSVTVNVNGAAYSTSFGSASTALSIAQAIASNMASNAAVRVTSVTNPSGTSAVINMQALNSGAAGNSINITSSYTNSSSNFPTPSFTTSPGSATMSGGSNAVPGTTVYDSGNVSVAIGSFSATALYSQSGNSTSAMVASSLATALSAASSPVTAMASGSSINITYKTYGFGGNVALSCNSSTSETGYFSSPSFSCSGTSLSGGLNSEGPSLDHNFFVTKYAYDPLGNLVNVIQEGDPAVTPSSQWRSRSFTYDSLSRLVVATNPETGTISYSYDANGNLLQKTSPAPNQTGAAQQVLSYCYDALNRVTGKAYSAQTCTNGRLPSGTSVVSYNYDSGANGIGKMTSLTDQAGSGSYTYSALGQITTENRIIGGMTKSLSYTYNLDNSVATMTYPSGMTVTYTPDSAGRPVQAVDLGNNINYATAAAYGPESSLTGFTSGQATAFGGITNAFTFNNRLQPINMKATIGSAPQALFSIDYDFHWSAGDNGNVWAITNNKDTTRNQTFSYDALNRLNSAQNAGTDCSKTTVNGKTQYWGNSYSYDAWGNLLGKSVTKCSAENLQVTATSNNQLLNYGYDAAGNMTHDLSDSGASFTFDQENRISGTAGFAYTYDDEGNRVEKSNGTTGTLYWYMLPGVVGESDLAGNLKTEYVFFGGKRVARRDLPTGNVSYYFSDLLNTASVVTDASGKILNESDFYPWGGELQFVNNLDNHYKFTGKERDGETGLDYFGARYYSNSMGRFLTPDWAAKATAVPYADLKDPQSLNLYSYVRNRPTFLVDPDGHKESSQQTQNTDGSSITWDLSNQQLIATQVITVTTKDADGTTTISSTTTIATYSIKDGEEGKALGFTTSSSSTTFNPEGKAVSSSNVATHDISAGEAGKLMTLFGGATGLSQIQQSAHGDAISKFPGKVAEDMKAHPFQNLGRALFIGFLVIDPPTTPLGVAAAVSGAATDLGSSLNGEDK